MPKAFNTCPKSNKLPDLVTLPATPNVALDLEWCLVEIIIAEGLLYC